MTRHTSIIALSIGLACMASPTFAEEKAHVHGHGKLNLAFDGSELEIELIAPGADIVGFEHAATTDEDKAAVQAAAAKLKEAVTLMGIPAAAKCSLKEVEIESALLEDGDHDHDDHKDEHGHKDEDQDDHADKDEHDHDDHKDEHAHDDHDKEDGEQHAEFHAHYHFDCDAPDELTHMDLSYFKQFPNAQELEVQAITAFGQISTELTADQPRLDLK